MSEIRIDEEFEHLIPQLTEDEYKHLKDSIVADGCRDALVVWNDVLIDGHNRYKICNEHDIQFQTVEKNFTSRDDAKIWILKNQLGRRNLNDFQRIEIVRKCEDAIKTQAEQRMLAGKADPMEKLPQGASRDELGKMAGTSGKTYEHATKVMDNAPKAVIEAVRNNELSIDGAYGVTKMTEDEQNEIAERIKDGEKPKTVVSDVKKRNKQQAEENAIKNETHESPAHSQSGDKLDEVAKNSDNHSVIYSDLSRYSTSLVPISSLPTIIEGVRGIGPNSGVPLHKLTQLTQEEIKCSVMSNVFIVPKVTINTVIWENWDIFCKRKYIWKVVRTRPGSVKIFLPCPELRFVLCEPANEIGKYKASILSKWGRPQTLLHAGSLEEALDACEDKIDDIRYEYDIFIHEANKKIRGKYAPDFQKLTRKQREERASLSIFNNEKYHYIFRCWFLGILDIEMIPTAPDFGTPSISQSCLYNDLRDYINEVNKVTNKFKIKTHMGFRTRYYWNEANYASHILCQNQRFSLSWKDELVERNLTKQTAKLKIENLPPDREGLALLFHEGVKNDFYSLCKIYDKKSLDIFSIGEMKNYLCNLSMYVENLEHMERVVLGIGRENTHRKRKTGKNKGVIPDEPLTQENNKPHIDDNSENPTTTPEKPIKGTEYPYNDFPLPGPEDYDLVTKNFGEAEKETEELPK